MNWPLGADSSAVVSLDGKKESLKGLRSPRWPDLAASGAGFASLAQAVARWDFKIACLIGKGLAR